jgi:hypothetical protein
MKYCDFEVKNDNPNKPVLLVITLLPEGHDEICSETIKGRNIDSNDFMNEVFEHQLCNGWEWIRPEEIGALTDAPILSNTVKRDEDGKLVNCDRVYWFPDYAVESPIRTLYNDGKVVFIGVG